MPEYRDDRGRRVLEDNPDRLVWFGGCTWWSDDISALGRGGYTCPHCGAPKETTRASLYFAGMELLTEEWPDYADFLEGLKEVCKGRKVRVLDAWTEHQIQKRRRLNG